MKNNLLLFLISICITASGSAATITAIQNGDISSISTWNLNRAPVSTDIVIIPAGITVNIINTPYSINPAASRPTLYIKIYGTLDFSDPGNDKLYLHAGSTIDVFVGGIVQTTGNSEIIAIYNGSSDNTVWDGSQSPINGPAHADQTTTGFQNGVLPLNLISFEATSSNNGNGQLSWITDGESNTSHFEIESFESTSHVWVKKGNVNAAGNSQLKKYYSFTVSLTNGTNQFRLKQVDIDGKSTYSPVKKIDYSFNDISLLIYSASSRTLQITCTSKQSEVSIFDLNGRKVIHYNLSEGSNSIHLTAATTGIYIAQLKEANKILSTRKILVQ